MKESFEAKLIRIYVGERDKYKGKPLYEEILKVAREQKLSGVTVLRGIAGFGAKAHMHTLKILELSENLPIVIEAVDSADKIEALLTALDGVMTEGLATVEDLTAHRFFQ